MNSKDKPKEFLRIGEAAKLLDVHANTLRNWDRTGILKPVRIGIRKERRYKRADVMKLMENSK